jgi:hypothetical protein
VGTVCGERLLGHGSHAADVEELTSGMGTGFGVVHDKGERFRGRLFFEPEPFVVGVVGQVIHLANSVWDNAIRCNKVFGIHRPAIAQGEGTIF